MNSNRLSFPRYIVYVPSNLCRVFLGIICSGIQFYYLVEQTIKKLKMKNPKVIIKGEVIESNAVLRNGSSSRNKSIYCRMIN